MNAQLSARHSVTSTFDRAPAGRCTRQRCAVLADVKYDAYTHESFRYTARALSLCTDKVCLRYAHSRRVGPVRAQMPNMPEVSASRVRTGIRSSVSAAVCGRCAHSSFTLLSAIAAPPARRGHRRRRCDHDRLARLRHPAVRVMRPHAPHAARVLRHILLPLESATRLAALILPSLAPKRSECYSSTIVG